MYSSCWKATCYLLPATHSIIRMFYAPNIKLIHVLSLVSPRRPVFRIRFWAVPLPNYSQEG
ncbi:hypothetical protein BofuT4_P015470.1 [Botrytis cinerea T4]|uniref:Uncharacterized protein n=1 Tax=Botryotinia fuckeliana (strain T4) TaxID=999810 RepID=G2YHQ4_BOTF4|nr:hypothetical protein BofuT4_P015470.1 [Botrytis cinerea T4]